jgi:hypothetical protein
MATLVRTEEPTAAPPVPATTSGLDPAYLAVAAVLLVLVVAEAIAARWGSGDFWEHAAAVRALAEHPLHPHHPLLHTTTPSAFFTPYHLVVGLFSRLTGIGAMGSLATFGVLNVALVLATLPAFVRLFTTRRHAPTLVLLFTLLLWGPHPILWSGRLHLDVIASNAPFPSAFAIGLTFAGLVAWDRHLRTGDRRALVLVVADSALLVLVHPTTAALFLLGVGALWLGAPTDGLRRRGWTIVPVGVAAVVAAVAWPYFSMLEVVTTWGERFYASDRALYTGVLREVAPALLGVPFLVTRLRARRRDPLATYAGLLALELVAGRLTGHWNLGRSLPFLVLTLHVALADGLLRWWAAGRPVPRRTFAAIAVPVAVAGLLVSANNLRSGWLRAVPSLPAPLQEKAIGYHRADAGYAEVLRGLGGDDVVLATDHVAWEVPTYGPKVVSALHAQAFVPDVEARRRAVERFFSAHSSDAERTAIADRYGARYALVDDRRPAGADAASLARIGSEVRARGPLHLIRLGGA